MKYIWEYGLQDPIYVFVGNDGEQVVIDTKALYEWCRSQNLPVFDVPVDVEVALEMLTDNSIQPDRLRTMKDNPDKYTDPVIFVLSGSETNGRPDAMLVDGHHRYMRAWEKDDQFIAAHVLTLEQWEPFRILGAPRITQGHARQMEVRPTREDT